MLSSGSHGNSTVLDNGQDKICIDFGVKSFKLWNELSSARGIKVEDITALLVTHSHTDHIDSIDGFISRRGNANVYTTAKVANDMSRSKATSRFKLDEFKEIILGSFAVIGSWEVKPIKMKHDGIGMSKISECVGFHLVDKVNNKHILYATDTNNLNNVEVPANGFDLLMIEANYDEKLEEEIWNMSSQSLIEEIQHRRTITDHLSFQKLTTWLAINDLFGVPLIQLHESTRNKMREQWFSTEAHGGCYREYFTDVAQNKDDEQHLVANERGSNE